VRNGNHNAISRLNRIFVGLHTDSLALTKPEKCDNFTY